MVSFLLVIENEEARNKLEYLYIKHHKEMIYRAYQIIGDFQLAEDVVQTSFIKLADYIEKIDDLDCNKTRGLIAIIVKHTAIDFNRKQRRHICIVLLYTRYIR